MLWVTVCTDISFSSQHNLATCAYAISSVCLRKIIYNVTKIDAHVKDSTVAEIIGITEGLYAAYRIHKNIKKGIIGYQIFTDNKSAQEIIMRNQHHRYDITRELQRIQGIANLGFFINVIWIKGHSENKDRLSKLNRRVDSLAHKKLRELVNEHQP